MSVSLSLHAMPGAAADVGLSAREAALQDLGVLVGMNRNIEPCIQAGAAKVRKERDPLLSNT